MKSLAVEFISLTDINVLSLQIANNSFINYN